VVGSHDLHTVPRFGILAQPSSILARELLVMCAGVRRQNESHRG